MIKQLRSHALVVIGLLCSVTTMAQFPYNDSFKNSTAPGSVLGGTATLTSGSLDPTGSGYLRLTAGAASEAGYAYNHQVFPSADGVSVTFEYYSHSGGGPYQADGISFFLFDASAISDVPDTPNGYDFGFSPGANGGSLGYSQSANFGLAGARKGFIGIGFDEFGNFRTDERGKPGTNVGGLATQEWVTIRGDGYGMANNVTNYEVVTEIQTTTAVGIGGSFTVQGKVDGRTAGNNGLTSTTPGYRKARVEIVPNGATGLAKGFIVNVWITEGNAGGGIVHHVINNQNYIPNNGITTGAALIPANFGYGYGSSTGGFTNIHEVRNLDIVIPASVRVIPVAVADVATTFQGQSITFDITSNDYDGNGNFQLNLNSVDLDPATPGQQTSFTNSQGTYTVISGIGRVTFTPVQSFSGVTIPIAYAISDTGNDIDGVNQISSSTSATASITVTVNSTNVAPEGANSTLTILEDSEKAFTANDFGFSDPSNSPSNSFASVKINALPMQGTLRLSGVPVTTGQFIPVAGISNLIFTPISNENGDAYATFSFQVQDDGGTANGGVNLDPTPNTITINVTPVNDYPVFLKGENILIQEDSGPQTFTNWATTIAPGPANESSQTVSFIISANSNESLFSSAPAISPTGTLTFTPASNASGTAVISALIKDNGGVVNGGIDQFVQQFVITITPVNDAPSGTDKTITIAANSIYQFTTSDFGFSDTDDIPPNSFVAVKISSLPAGGRLRLGALSVGAGDIISLTNISILTYSPTQNENGSPYTTFTFQVQDNGSDNNLDLTPSTITFNVGATSGTPIGTSGLITGRPNILGSGVFHNTSFSTADFGFTDPNSTPPNNFTGVVIVEKYSAHSLKLNGVTVLPGAFIPVADIPNLQFSPYPLTNYTDTTFPIFTFKVKDDAATNNLDLIARTMSFKTKPNTLPVTSNIVKSADANSTITFSLSDFTSKFTDVDQDALYKIKIVDLPSAGTLKLNNTIITNGQEIPVANIENLTYTSASSSGTMNFHWNGSDGESYAASASTVSITVGSTSFATYTETFKNTTAQNMTYGGNQTAELTASTNTDADGAGYLRLTNNSASQIGYTYNNTFFPSSAGISASFEYYSHSGGNPYQADGISFFLFDSSVLSDASNAVYQTPGFTIGGPGSALGYANFDGTPGLRKAFIGLGLDEFGNFARYDRGKGTASGDDQTQENVTLRGDGSGTSSAANYEFLTYARTNTGASPFKVQGQVDGRTKGAAGLTPFDTGYRKAKLELTTSVDGGYLVNVWITEGNPSGPIVHHVITNYQYNPTGAIPANLSYGFAASTGGFNNFHEIRNLSISTPQTEVIESPAITFSGPTTAVCAGTLSAQLPYTSTGSPNQYSLIWDNAAIIAGLTNVINAPLTASPLNITAIASLLPGTYTATITVRNSGTGLSSTSIPFSIIINAKPTAPAAINGNTTLIPGGTTTLLSLTPAGTWTSSLPAVATISSNGLVTAIMAGSTTITYTVTNGSGCSSSITTLVTVDPGPALTFPYVESFKYATAPGMLMGGTDPAKLTGNGTIDANGEGYLRLTNNGASQLGYAYNIASFPSANGLIASFEYYSHTGSSNYQADGLSFFLFDSNVALLPATPIYPSAGFNIGGPGSALGYTNFDALPGLRKAFFGMGLDEFGNFARFDRGKSTASGDDQTQENITLRGYGDGETGPSLNYKFLTYAQANSGSAPFKVQGRVDGRTKGAAGLTEFDPGYRKAKVELTPNPAGGYYVNVWITEGNPSGGILHHVITNYAYTSTGVIPERLSYGFAASTGGFNNYHEIRNLSIDAPEAPAAIPTITVTNANPVICKETATALVTFSAASPSANQYTITWDAAALTAGLTNTTGALQASPITVAGLASIAAGTYHATLTISNGTASSAPAAISLTINSKPDAPAAITGNTSVTIGGTSLLSSVSPGGIWTSSNLLVASVNSSTGLVNAQSAGTSIITYTLTNTSGCIASISTTVTITPGPSLTLPYSETFRNPSAPRMVYGGSPAALLTADGTIDANNAGYLRLTNNGTSQLGYAYNTSSFPSATGLNVSFEYYTHTGSFNYQADGMSFFLFDSNVSGLPAGDGYTTAGFNIGGAGSALGYTNFNGTPGLRKAFLAVGLDEFGNFARFDNGKGSASGDEQTLENITLRGDGDGPVASPDNYKFLTYAKTNTGLTPFKVQGEVDGRTKGADGLTEFDLGYRKAKIDLTTGPGGYYVNVWITEGNPAGGIIHHVIADYLYIPKNGIPASLSYGFAASTGGFNNYHEIRNLNIDHPAPPAVTLATATQAICIGTAATRLPYSVVTGFADKYSITWDAAAITAGLVNVASASLSGDTIVINGLSGIAAGTYHATVKAINSNSGVVGDGSAITLTINALPAPAAITGTTIVSIGTTITLANTTSGGVWASNTPSIATINSSGVVTPISVGTSVITYKVTNASGCINTVSITILVTESALTLATLPFNDTFKLPASTNAVTGGNAILTGGATDASGTGYLKLTDNSNSQFGYYQNKFAFPTANGLTYTFDYYSYGGETTNATYQADGLSLFLYDSSVMTDGADAANGYSNAGFSIGAAGGSLGYANRANTGQPGLRKGFLALGLDEFGNFRTDEGGKQGINLGGAPTQEWVTLRGDGNGIANVSTNYEVLTAVQATNTSIPGGAFTIQGKVDGRAITSVNNPGYRSAKLELVPNGLGTGFKINVWVYEGRTPGLISHHLISDYDYIPQGGVPANLSFGFASSTGGFTNVHEVRNMNVYVPDATLPTISLITNTINICEGIPEISGIWLGSNGSPNEFSVAWDASALSAGFTNIVNRNFETSPMKIAGLAGIVPGTYIGMFSVRNSTNGLSSTPQPITIVINPAPVVQAISGANVVLVGNTIQLTNPTPGGIWSTFSPATATVSSTGLVTGVSAGLESIKYTVTNASGCATSSQILVTVYSSTSSAQFPSTTTFKNVASQNTVLGGSAVLTAPATDTDNNGYLRLTGASSGEFGYARNTTAFPAGNGLSATFEYFSHSGSNSYQADGFSFFLYDPAVVNALADPSNGYSAGFNIGANGGALGYAQAAYAGLPGLRKGFLAIGFDEFGNFRTDERGKPGVNVGGIPTQEWITLRGDGDGTANIPTNYELLTAIQTTDAANASTINGNFSVQGKVDGRTISGGLTPYTTGRRKATVDLTPLSGNSGYLVNVYIEEGTPSGPVYHHVIKNYQYTPTDGIPSQLGFGFAGTSGGFTNIHEIRNVTVSIPQSVIVVPVAVSDAASTIQNQPVTFDITSNDYDGNGNLTLDLTSVDLDINAAGQQTAYTTPEGTYSFTFNGIAGRITFTPTAGFYGTTAPLGYTIKDSGAGIAIISTSNTAYITVSVSHLQTITNVNTQDGAGDGQLFAIIPKDTVSEPAGSLDANNIMSPNNDGKNDVWLIRNLNLFPKHEITITDRNGRVVYFTKNYQNNWNGSYNGSPLPEGTYYYIIDVGGKKPMKGFISIVY